MGPGHAGDAILTKMAELGGRSGSTNVGCWPLQPVDTGGPGGRLGSSRKTGRGGVPRPTPRHQGEREVELGKAGKVA